MSNAVGDVSKEAIVAKMEAIQADLQSTVEQHDKAQNTVNELSKLFDRQQGALIGLRQLKEELFGPEEASDEKEAQE